MTRLYGCPLIFQNIRLPELAPFRGFALGGWLIITSNSQTLIANSQMVAEVSQGRSLHLSG
jgi:hypothetical protein